MTPHEVANRAAEEVLQVIERNRRINKSEIAEAIEKVLLIQQVTPVYALADDASRQMQRMLCGND